MSLLEKSHGTKEQMRLGKTNAQARHVKKFKEKSDESSHVDLAPLVDIAFLLLTFFMLTTTFAKPNVMEMGLPEDSKGGKTVDVKPDNVLTIRISKTGKAYLNQGLDKPKNLEFDKIKDEISKFVKSNPYIITTIKVDKDAEYYVMVDIVDEVYNAGVRKFALADMNDKEKAEIDEIEAGNSDTVQNKDSEK
ncbi:ExbD/TolR family protein [Chloroherpeton thalassium]|uniref:ExbD/TolR family protein n=1 Tax=Chloroherpeton thalassium TaxID=100716 RepID=UPI0002E98445|nr:biopolymer transporter ExbD [Chloroherpeton thalassium]